MRSPTESVSLSIFSLFTVFLLGISISKKLQNLDCTQFAALNAMCVLGLMQSVHNICTVVLQTKSFEICRYGSILLSDGRSLKDLSKELADQSKLGDRAKQFARIKDSKSCAGCDAQDDLAPCQSCDSAWCSNCAKYDTGDLSNLSMQESRSL